MFHVLPVHELLIPLLISNDMHATCFVIISLPIYSPVSSPLVCVHFSSELFGAFLYIALNESRGVVSNKLLGVPRFQSFLGISTVT